MRDVLTKDAVVPAQQKSLQHLGNIAWSFSVLIIRGQPLSDAIALEAFPTLLWHRTSSQDCVLPFGLPWSLWRVGSASFGLCMQMLPDEVSDRVPAAPAVSVRPGQRC